MPKVGEILSDMTHSTDCSPSIQPRPPAGAVTDFRFIRFFACVFLLFCNVSVANASDCLDPANLGTVGNSGECAGMLIVNRAMLFTAKNDGTYAINGADGNVYTFGNSQYNIFTGQVDNLTQYDATLNGWAALEVSAAHVPSFSFSTSAGSAARESLIEQGWTIDRDALMEDLTAASLTSSPVPNVSGLLLGLILLLLGLFSDRRLPS